MTKECNLNNDGSHRGGSLYCENCAPSSPTIDDHEAMDDMHRVVYEYDYSTDGMDAMEAIDAEDAFNHRALQALRDAAGEEPVWSWSGSEVGGLEVLVSPAAAAKLKAAGYKVSC
jgi:hypothetical protein